MDTNAVIEYKLSQRLSDAIYTATQAYALLEEAQINYSNAKQLLEKALNNAQGTENYELIGQAEGMFGQAESMLRHTEFMLGRAVGIENTARQTLENIKHIPQEAQRMMLEQEQVMLEDAQRMLEEAQGMLEDAQRMLVQAQSMLPQAHVETLLGTNKDNIYNSYQKSGVTTSTNGVYNLKCSTDDTEKTVTFTISSLESEINYLTFTLQLLYNEGIVYAFGNNNVIKINELNKCTVENINVDLKQYYYIDNDIWSNIFEVVLSVNNTDKNSLCAQVVNNKCIGEETKKYHLYEHKEFIPFVRVDNNINNNPPPKSSVGEFAVEDAGEHAVEESWTPVNSQTPQIDFFSHRSSVSAKKVLAMEEINNLDVYVNEIVMNPNHNINGLTDITKRFYNSGSEDIEFPQVNHIFQEQINRSDSKNMSISEQITHKNQTGPMDIKRRITKAKCDCLDIRHDIRTILRETHAIKHLNDRIDIDYSTLADGLVNQHKLVDTAQQILEEVENDMLFQGYIFEKIPPTVQQTNFQVFTEFIADVIIKAINKGGDIKKVLPFVYEESGRGLNFENFKKFYNMELVDKDDKHLFYINLYEIINVKISHTNISEINKYVDAILILGGNHTTIPKSKIQQIDACKVGRTHITEESSEGKICEVFGCLDVTIHYKNTENRKNIYLVTISSSLDSKHLMSCDITQDIPLKAVSNYLNNNYKDLITLHNKTGGKVTANTRSDDCEERDSGGTDGNDFIVKFFTDHLDTRALCIEALKTVCDKLYKLRFDEVEKISTSDDLVRVDPRIEYLYGKKSFCPSVYRLRFNGFVVYGGTTTENDYSEIFYRNFVSICFLCNSSEVLRKLDIEIDDVGKKLHINETDYEKISSNRLINYIKRLVILNNLCKNESKKRYSAYEKWMIKIICCDLEDKIKKIKEYINQINTIIGNYSTNNNFSDFYRNIIGLDNLEQLLTMSSLNFFYSNEDNIFNEERTNKPENTCEDNGFYGEWIKTHTEMNVTSDVTSDVTSVNDLLDSIINVEFLKNGVEIEDSNDTLISNETKITFKSAVKIQSFKNRLKSLLVYPDEGKVSATPLQGPYSTNNKAPLFIVPTTLELLFKLIMSSKKTEKQDSNTEQKPSRSQRNNSNVKNATPRNNSNVEDMIVKVIKKMEKHETILQQIVNITEDFMKQIGIHCKGLNIEDLKSHLPVSSDISMEDICAENDKVVKTIKGFICSEDSSTHHKPGGGSDNTRNSHFNVHQVNPQQVDPQNIHMPLQKIVLMKIGRKTHDAVEVNPHEELSRGEIVTYNNGKNDAIVEYVEGNDVTISLGGNQDTRILKLNELDSTWIRKLFRTTDTNYDIKRGGSRKNLHKKTKKVTRRKTTKSPKRKTIKKRKMPKRKNKTRRNK